MAQEEQVDLSAVLAEIRGLSERIEALEKGGAVETTEDKVLDVVREYEHPKTAYDLIQNVVLGVVFLVFVVRTVAMSRYGKRDGNIQNEQLRIERMNQQLLVEIGKKLGLKFRRRS